MCMHHSPMYNMFVATLQMSSVDSINSKTTNYYSSTMVVFFIYLHDTFGVPIMYGSCNRCHS